MPKFDPTFSLGQVCLAASFLVGGAASGLGFVYGTRGDITLLKYQLEVNEKGDAARSKEADQFRDSVLVELRGIRDEIMRLRIEMQDKEPRRK